MLQPEALALAVVLPVVLPASLDEVCKYLNKLHLHDHLEQQVTHLCEEHHE